MDKPVSRLVIVVGGQYGSEGKGAVCAALATGCGSLTAVRTGGPNAGHTVYDETGRKWTFSQLPISAVVRPDARLVIAAGSEIYGETLYREISEADQAGFDVTGRLWIDQEATILTAAHRNDEGHYGGHLAERLGSTGKGVGAARADRIARKADVYGGEHDTAEMLTAEYLAGGRTIMLEGSQGFALGLHAGWYPFCTSRDCRAIDELSLVGILPQVAPEVWVVLRSYPIRVAGNSGPMSDEMTWGQLSTLTDGYIHPEYTTVTKQLRRVGNWDPGLAARAVRCNGGRTARVALTMFDYSFPELFEATSIDDLTERHWDCIHDLEQGLGCPVAMVGTGPATQIRLSLEASVAA